VTPSLFFPTARWPAILRLDSDTAKGRVFLALRSGGWISGERLADVGGFDFRTRASRLRDLGIPVETEPSKTSPCYRYRIPPAFIDEYEWRRRKIA
jgi:biotin operon repressor